MDWYRLQEWSNLFVRWFHVVAGITWIGQTYLFNWMEKTLPKEIDPEAEENVDGQLWMVHGGGFYLVEKQKMPKLMPRTLHWFKWESALTWISGFVLLSIVYYMGGLMVEADAELSETAAVAVSLGLLVFGWIIYRLLWLSPLGKMKSSAPPLAFSSSSACLQSLTESSVQEPLSCISAPRSEPSWRPMSGSPSSLPSAR